jgi:hypothetical protein
VLYLFLASVLFGYYLPTRMAIGYLAVGMLVPATPMLYDPQALEPAFIAPGQPACPDRGAEGGDRLMPRGRRAGDGRPRQLQAGQHAARARRRRPRAAVGGGDPDLGDAARLGGDEFALLVSDTDEADLARLAQRIVEQLRSAEVALKPPGFEVTASVGFALLDPRRGVDEVLDAADGELRRAKRAGKDRWAAIGAA